ncbi:MAG: hypothetical protein Q8T08_04250 [Ignavibacteria bacterium]|nr:hypothetical protein [Ignavibacteria bacterium]
MNTELKHVLFEVSQKLNNLSIIYGVGASTMLKLRGIDISVHDIDIMVKDNQFMLAYNCLMTFCDEQIVEPSSLFKTTHFKRFSYKGIDIDLMSGISIVHESGIFKYSFDMAEKCLELEKILVPICFMEDWFVFYHLMPNRVNTINLIKSYFLSHPVNKSRLLKIIDLSLPNELRQALLMYTDN